MYALGFMLPIQGVIYAKIHQFWQVLSITSLLNYCNCWIFVSLIGMILALMTSVKLPRQVDFEKMGQSRAHLAGSLELTEFVRLLPSLVNNKGQVTIDLHFSRDPKGAAHCTGEATLECSLQCQRCLTPYLYTLKAPIGLTAVKNDEEALGIASGMEPIITNGEVISLAGMIEDELLLLMPHIPKHASEQCPVEVITSESETNKLELELKEWKAKLNR